MEIVVIGNGIVGLSCAYGLASRFKNISHITIIGKQRRRGAATTAAAAMHNSFAELEYDTLRHKQNKLKFEISCKSTELWPKFLKDIEDKLEKKKESFQTDQCSKFIKNSGMETFVINNGVADALDDKNFDAIVDGLKIFNKKFENINPTDIPGYKPQPKYRALRAISIEEEGWSNPIDLLEKIEAALLSYQKCTFLDEQCSHITEKNGVVKKIKTEEGNIISGDLFILAAGADCSSILYKSNLNDLMQRIFYGIGTTIEIKSNSRNIQDSCIRTPNRGLACGTYAVPRSFNKTLGSQHLVIGASNLISHKKEFYPSMTSITTIMKAAQTEINSDHYKANLIDIKTGFRPTSSDTFPLIGWSDISNLFILTGTKRDGYHLAPFICYEVSNLVMKKESCIDIELFKPCRRPIRNLSRSEAVEKAVEHQISAEFQHGYTPALNGSLKLFVEKLRSEVEIVHDRAGALDWGIQPEMLGMYKHGHI